MSDTDARRLLPEERYNRDVTFHHLVDVLEAMIHRCEMTPTEIREAAMLAAIHHERHRTRWSFAASPQEMAQIMEMKSGVRTPRDIADPLPELVDPDCS